VQVVQETLQAQLQVKEIIQVVLVQLQVEVPNNIGLGGGGGGAGAVGGNGSLPGGQGSGGLEVQHSFINYRFFSNLCWWRRWFNWKWRCTLVLAVLVVVEMVQYIVHSTPMLLQVVLISWRRWRRCSSQFRWNKSQTGNGGSGVVILSVPTC
jgi:hypothetical protein